MQNKFLPVLVAVTVLTVGARAQNPGVAVPASNAPVVQTPTPAGDMNYEQPAPAPVAAAPQTAPVANQTIFAPRLPTPQELTSAAAAQGLTVEQINQGASQIIVVYRHASGQTNTVAYQLLPVAAPPAVVSAAPATVVVQNPAPTVVYQESPRVIYYDSYDPFWPRYSRPYYPPVSLSFGFGYYSGWGGGYGHHRHHHHRHHHRGHHRW